MCTSKAHIFNITRIGSFSTSNPSKAASILFPSTWNPWKQPQLPKNCYTLFFQIVTFEWGCFFLMVWPLSLSVAQGVWYSKPPGPRSSCHWGHDVLMARCLFSPHGSWKLKICSLIKNMLLTTSLWLFIRIFHHPQLVGKKRKTFFVYSKSFFFVPSLFCQVFLPFNPKSTLC